MWRKEGAEWKITHHHSSVVPAAAASARAASGSDDPKTKLLQAKKAELGLGAPRKLFGSATLARMYYGAAATTTTDTSLPAGYKVVRLHQVESLETRKKLMAQVHDVIRQNYGSYADSESPDQWLDNLAKSGLNSADPLCKLLVTMVLDGDGVALGFSSAEVLPAGDRRYIYNAYTCVRDKKDDDVVIQIVKQDIFACAKKLRDDLARDGVQVLLMCC